MSEIFSNLTFNRIILHNVHKPNDNGAVPASISLELTTLDKAGKQLLQERVSKVLGSGSGSLAMDVANKTPASCFEYSKQLLQANDKVFISTSAAIAHHHTAIHTSRRWPGGTLVIISGTTGTDSRRCIIIIKAEQQAGFTETAEDGKITLAYLENLILTPQSKLYKIGIFYETVAKTSGTIEDLNAHVFDSNIKSDDDRQAAKYFYSGFLGLKIPENAIQRTRDFFEYASDFISGMDTEPERKIDLQQALYTYLKTDKSTTIETAEFAQKYLNNEESDDFSHYMESKGFPDSAVTKDTKLINRKLARRKLNFTNNVKITAPADNFSELIQVLESTEDDTTLKIRGVLLSQDK
ncbi:hypothetical protein IPC1146_10265 [Pseudomonas aeruginosa]|uniref:nucleoid-associated protein n=1 Tax=Pseudomonas aeruginosa TaxID=287 RepID=UPI000FD31221|nr:nucleoid-associated protein [Pseudomonas aeruginosa]MDV7896653.1 nucleoid-associated protein [Pseudomonas aeruginosa]MED5087631.1 nucleoid-associated protein [Pseudomonas aeruginosa]RUF13295.1 hypothetical protein IPC1146_10265 [Pseudomonas aeruginosa]HBO2000444.1 nucleoid-associated protein [Pseudomonas aeruginosa]HCK4685842.1 nucleoid-associated protein [Pseudomonas aeruginosa]